MKDQPNFLGVYSHNNLPNRKDVNVNQSNNSLIINYNDDDQAGSHWVCVYGKNEFYDSFGVVPSTTIQNWIRNIYKTKKGNIHYPSHQQQHLTTSTCGYFCMEYIRLRNKGIDMYDILHNHLNFDTLENEKKIMKYYNASIS